MTRPDLDTMEAVANDLRSPSIDKTGRWYTKEIVFGTKPRALLDAAADALDGQGAYIRELEAERLKLPEDIDFGSIRFRKGVKLITFINAARRWFDLARHVAASESRTRELEGALEEITVACEADFGAPDDGDEDDEPVGRGMDSDMAVTFGILRRARTALRTTGGEEVKWAKN